MQEQEVKTVAETIEWLARQRMKKYPQLNFPAAISCVDVELQEALFQILEKDRNENAFRKL